MDRIASFYQALAGTASRLEFFSATVENQFVFHLFDLLLCGVIVLVILKRWRAHSRDDVRRSEALLFLAFLFLGASFATGAAPQGAFLFLHSRLPQKVFDLLEHALRAATWLALAASALTRRPRLSAGLNGERFPLQLWLALAFVFLWQFSEPLGEMSGMLARASDTVEIILLAAALVFTYRRPLAGRDIATVAILLLCSEALFHLGSVVTAASRASTIFWNFEQFAGIAALFVFALAIGEASPDLFDKVFVRLQIAFILLASFMTLVIIQTEKAEYLSNVRSRSDQLAEFVRADVVFFRGHGQELPAIVDRKDFLQRLTFGFGNLPELKLIRITAGSETATFEISEQGQIRRNFTTLASTDQPASLDPLQYFAIHVLPLPQQGSGQVEFYVTREFLDNHIRNRIVLIFFLFTAMVALSTIMIGVVVRGASAVIRQQAQEIEKTQQQLLQASKLAAIGELAAGVAHEINNPATTILSMTSFWLSKHGAADSPGDPEDVQEVMTQARRIAQITSALLTFSRRQVLQIEPVKVSRVIESGLRPVEDLLQARGIVVEKYFPNSLPRVMADEDSLARAFENLFRNAIDAMPQGGTLCIRAARDGSSAPRIRLEVIDTGAGMEEHIMQRIFDPFFTTKDVGKGTGLGLSLVHGIIKEHQGTIGVESTPRVGTKFFIVLPSEG